MYTRTIGDTAIEEVKSENGKPRVSEQKPSLLELLTRRERVQAHAVWLKVKTIYDLTGRKLKGENGNLKGVYIINGKKVLVK